MGKIEVTVDIVLLTIRAGRLHVLLIERGSDPFQGKWALPGGFVAEGESLEDAALRELKEETGVARVYLEQLYTFGEPGRDPRGRVVTVAYYALVASEDLPLRAGARAAGAEWFAIAQCPALAFDHGRILETALTRLRNKLSYTTVGFQLLPEKFTLPELQAAYQAILGKKLDKRNFRRQILQQKLVQALNEYQYTGRKPAQLFRFVERAF